MPRELRDLVYEFIIGYTDSVYVIEPPDGIFRYDPSRSVACCRFSLLGRASPFPSAAAGGEDGDDDGDDAAAQMRNAALLELTSLFFATNAFYVRYRYSALMVDFLTTAFVGVGCVPVQHLRSLHILLAPPETAEESSWCDDAEFEWNKLFPRPVNAKCVMYREDLEAEFERVKEATREAEIDLCVCVEDAKPPWSGEDEGRGVREWFEGWWMVCVERKREFTVMTI